jgi:hypothetical protein
MLQMDMYSAFDTIWNGFWSSKSSKTYIFLEKTFEQLEKGNFYMKEDK